MFNLIFVDDFGCKTTIKTSADKKALEQEADRKNQSLEQHGEEEYGFYYVN